MRLILVRHGQTSGNRHSYVGREDLQLDATGRAQAMELVDTLAREPITAIYSSTLRRAVETAQPLAERRGLRIEQRAALVEIDFGELQGTPKGRAPLSLRREHLVTPLPGGESLADVWRRLEPLAAELRGLLNTGGYPVVIGHYWSNRLLHDMLIGIPLDRALSHGLYKPANGGALSIDI